MAWQIFTGTLHVLANIKWDNISGKHLNGHKNKMRKDESETWTKCLVFQFAHESSLIPQDCLVLQYAQEVRYFTEL
jgi:hypothetical protein